MHDTGVANKPYTLHGYRKYRICDTAPCLLHTLRIGGALPVGSLHGVGLPLKPSRSQNGPALEEIRGTLAHPQNVLAGVANTPYLRYGFRKYVILRQRTAVAVHAPDRQRTTGFISAWCRATIEATV